MKNLTSKTRKIILTKNGELNKSISSQFWSVLTNEKDRKIYPIMYTGSGRYINTKDRTLLIEQILTAQGYKYIIGNDAPRGGKEGNFIKVSRTAFNFIKELISKR